MEDGWGTMEDGNF